MIEKQSHLYEVLIRFDETGFSGAHVLDLVKLIDNETGEVISTKVSDARPVTASEVGDLIGRDAALLIEKAVSEAARADVAEQNHQSVKRDLIAVKRERDELSRKLAAPARR